MKLGLLARRLPLQVRRFLRARRLGFHFVRCATFTVPESIQIGNRRVTLSLPVDQGLSPDFIGCVLNDNYGLHSLPRSRVSTILDIGANVGFFSLAARARFADATIHAYEPNPRIIEHLRHQAREAGFSVFAEAVGSQPGLVRIRDQAVSNQATTERIDSSEGQTPIPQITLSTAVERLGGTVDLAKIDCEGAEWDLFSDTSAWPHIRNVRMEYHLWGRHEFHELAQTLAGLGFAITRHAPEQGFGIVWARNRNG